MEVLRKRIKHLYVRVLPPDGRVCVSAPLRLTDRTLLQAVAARWPWITQQQARLAAGKRQPKRQYVTGETHGYLGESYLLNVVERCGPPRVEASDGRLDLIVRPGSDAAVRERVLWGWYRQRLKETLPALISKWEEIMGVEVAQWGVKRMRTRWGSCNIKAHRIWVNLMLATRPLPCLEYIIVHEMVHLLERRHNANFKAYMDHFLPQWRACRQDLISAPLGPAASGQ